MLKKLKTKKKDKGSKPDLDLNPYFGFYSDSSIL